MASPQLESAASDIAPMVPRVSVCIPAYNCEQTIERAIDSVLAQTFTDFECVVVDNASTDGTVARVQRYRDPRVRIVKNRRNIGLTGNHNKCLSVARADLIQFVHGDDWLLPHCLETFLRAFDSDTVGLAFAPRTVLTNDKLWLARYGRLESVLEPLEPINSGRELVRRFISAGGIGNPIGEPTSVMLRRDTIIAAGGFRSEVPQLMDVNAWMRMLGRCDAAFINEELAVRWHHDGSATDMYSGTALLDHMWVLTDLVKCAELPRSLRARVCALWLRALAKAPLVVLFGHRGERFKNAKAFGAQAAYFLFGNRIRFDVETNGDD